MQPRPSAFGHGCLFSEASGRVMTVDPHKYWRIVDEWKDAYGYVLAYRLRCSIIYFDKHHTALTREQIVSYIGEEEITDDYPSTVDDVRLRLERDLRFDEITSDIPGRVHGEIRCS